VGARALLTRRGPVATVNRFLIDRGQLAFRKAHGHKGTDRGYLLRPRIQCSTQEGLPVFWLIIVVWIFCGIGSAIVAENRGGSGCLWFGLGFLFGPFGLAFSFAAGDDVRCQACQKRVHPKGNKVPLLPVGN
jgi:hypothetical protein